MVPACDTSFIAFAPRVASFTDLQAAFRVLLQCCGMSAEEALSYSLHGWKHLLPTASRQLRQSNDETNQLGHWAPSSAMPLRYDATACTTELFLKHQIASALRDGWKLVNSGEVPMARQEKTLRTQGKPVEKFAPLSLPEGTKKLGTIKISHAAMPECRQVLNTKRKTAHVWVEGSSTTCNFFKCGTPCEPTDDAEFPDNYDCLIAPTSKFRLCNSCIKWLSHQSGISSPPSTPVSKWLANK